MTFFAAAAVIALAALASAEPEAESFYPFSAYYSPSVVRPYATAYSPYYRSAYSPYAAYPSAAYAYRFKREAEAEPEPEAEAGAYLPYYAPYYAAGRAYAPYAAAYKGVYSPYYAAAAYPGYAAAVASPYYPRFKREAEAEPEAATVYKGANGFHTNAANLAKGIHRQHAGAVGSLYDVVSPVYYGAHHPQVAAQKYIASPYVRPAPVPYYGFHY